MCQGPSWEAFCGQHSTSNIKSQDIHQPNNLTCASSNSAQGYGLAWSPFRQGFLLSGSDDAQICLWDINAANGRMLGAHAIYHQHLGVVEVRFRAELTPRLEIED